MPSSELSPITRRLGITPRIRALAACVPHGTRVFADIGTNHAILPIAVLREERVLRCIATDCSAATFVDARRRLRRSHLEELVELRLGDGLLPIANDEVDVICLAGLGPRTMADILENGLPLLTGRPVRLVLNPFGGCAEPRAVLQAHGFLVTSNSAVVERGRSYQIFVAERAR